MGTTGREKDPEGSVNPDPDEPPSGQADPAFAIVGIGASAGGLAAFEAFFSGMPGDVYPGMAFVLVQHLAPDHKSILTELVKRYTHMQVFEVEDGMEVRPNCAYIIPPNRDMAFLNGTLQLLEPAAPRGQRLPIDFFFRSLAQDQHERAICIVLSGTGSDGTLGLRAVKGEGGMAMAQSPHSTAYDGMPRSAIATGLVDYVLPAAEMPAQLMAYAAHAFGRASRPASHPASNAEDALNKIFLLLRSQTGHDFSQYKRNTVLRRVERRIAIHQIHRIEAYVRYLQQTPAEVETLFRDLLIGVTSFFRDPEAFTALKEHAIRRLFADRSKYCAVRVWIPGCSTGEEAYSIAMLLQECMEEIKVDFKLQLFATDIDHHAIELARAGVYPSSIAADVPAQRLSRFFTQEPEGTAYRICKSIRDMVLFSKQDVIKDPPFSKLDLISCRNLLIYLGGGLQKNIIPLFHYALNPGGMLYLGTSESPGGFVDLFGPLDRKAKLYERKDDRQAAERVELARLLPPRSGNGNMPRPFAKPSGQTKLTVREVTEQAMLQQYGRAGALVNDRGDILYLHGRTGQYLEFTAGEVSMNILRLAREGLRQELATALHKAAATGNPVSQGGLSVKSNGAFTHVDLTVQPVFAELDTAGRPGATLFLVIFGDALATDVSSREKAAAATVSGASVSGCRDDDARITALRHELRSKEECLQTYNDQLATSNEDLKSANQEMQSVNEELQCTNEELETSKEELQSVNEELATVNAELQTRVADLSRSNNDMNNLLAGTGIGMVFVDHQLYIQRFTPAITQVINLIPSDVGRPVDHIGCNLRGYDRLVRDIRSVLDTLVPKEMEVQTQKGAWYLLRIRPYRTLENVIEGAVITFTELSEMKRVQGMLQEFEALRRLAAIVRDAHDAIIAQDFEGRIRAWNPGAERLYGWSEAEALQMNIRDLIPAGKGEEALAQLRERSRAEVVLPFRMQRIAKDGRTLEVVMTATALMNEAGKPYAIATNERGMD